MYKEEIELIHKINPNIFGKDIIGVELKECNKCGKLMEWHNNKFVCNCVNRN